jgi:hypothetical protein
MREPKWARVDYGPIDYQDLYYYSAPKRNAPSWTKRLNNSSTSSDSCGVMASLLACARAGHVGGGL